MDFQFNNGNCIGTTYRFKYYRALSIILNKPWQKIKKDIQSFRKQIKKRKKISNYDIFQKCVELYLASLYFEWTPFMTKGSGVIVHLKKDELPNGKILASISGQLIAIIDGIHQDIEDKSRNGTRAVYGYYAPSFRTMVIIAKKH